MEVTFHEELCLVVVLAAMDAQKNIVLSCKIHVCIFTLTTDRIAAPALVIH